MEFLRYAANLLMLTDVLAEDVDDAQRGIDTKASNNTPLGRVLRQKY